MDLLSIISSIIIAVLHATTSILSVYYGFQSTIKHYPWRLEKAIDEVRDEVNKVKLNAV